jgi:hypothetical protein
MLRTLNSTLTEGIASVRDDLHGVNKSMSRELHQIRSDAGLTVELAVRGSIVSSEKSRSYASRLVLDSLESILVMMGTSRYVRFPGEVDLSSPSDIVHRRRQILLNHFKVSSV